jgi:pyridinium-3,5-biscarboxylic acid mononucleotide synthase
VFGTRADNSMFEAVKSLIAETVYFKEARIISIKRKEIEIPDTSIAVITAGTSDIPVAEEAAVTAELLGNKVVRIFDAGVAGIHRLVDKLPEIKNCRVVIVIAGMEGALASVVGGLVDKPVIAVPTSVGYGANFGGISALLAMLTSCSSGVTVVNIDNGFGAGFSASMINKMK